MATDPNAPPARPLSLDATADICYGVGFTAQQQLEDALAVVLAEHGGTIDASGSLINTPALGAKGPSIGSIDRGLFMLNNYWHSEVSNADAYDPARAAAAAYRISKGGSDWHEWSTWPTLANRYRAQAQAAAARRIATGGTGSSAGSSSDGSTADTGDGAGNLGASEDTPWQAGQLPVGYVKPLTFDDFWIGARPGSEVALPADMGIGPRILRGNIDLSADEVSELSIELLPTGSHWYDDGSDLIGAGIFAAPSAAHVVSDAAAAHLPSFRLRARVAAWQRNSTDWGSSITLTGRPVPVQTLRRVHAMADKSYAPTLTNVSPSEYLERLAVDAGARSLVQGSARRASIGPNKKGNRLETAYEVAQRLADEEGFMCFEAGDVLYFGQPRWLTARGAEVKVGWNAAWGSTALDALGDPDVRYTEDNTRAATISVVLPRYRGELVRPGMRLLTKGAYFAGGTSDWLVTRVSYAIDTADDVTVEAVKPEDKPGTLAANAGATKAVADENITGRGGAVSTVPGTGNALDFVTFALAQAGDRYQYGAAVSVNDPDPAAFDCSALVEWAAGRAGVAFPRVAVDQWRAVNKAGLTIPVADAIDLRGALLFRFGSNPANTNPDDQHVVISLGDGRTIEARGAAYGVNTFPTANRTWTHAGMLPGLDYGPARALLGVAA